MGRPFLCAQVTEPGVGSFLLSCLLRAFWLGMRGRALSRFGVGKGVMLVGGWIALEWKPT